MPQPYLVPVEADVLADRPEQRRVGVDVDVVGLPLMLRRGILEPPQV